jgi:radical SAM superfamily enzyme YgiQ (UPF0313 family)
MIAELILPRKEKHKFKDLGFYVVPQTLTQLAAVTSDDVDLILTDENLKDVDFNSGADLVGISVMTSQADRALEISRAYKARGATVVWGGIHPSAVDQAGNTSIDSFVVGEGEALWPQLIEDFRNGNLKRRYINTKPVNLNETPLPLRYLIKPEINIIIESTSTSRGCKYSCEHCSASLTFGKGIRFVEPDRVIRDIEGMDNKIVAFFDENMMSNPNYASSLMKRLDGYGKQYFIQVDPYSALDKDVAVMLSNAGVKLVFIGFESIYPENFRGNKKYVPAGEWRRIVDNLHENGIKVDGGFMFGMDFDDPFVFEKTEAEVKKAGIDFFSMGVLVPYPGTRLFQRLEREGRLFNRSWKDYDLVHCVFEPKSMAPEFLEQGVADLKSRYKSVFQRLGDVFDI